MLRTGTLMFFMLLPATYFVVKSGEKCELHLKSRGVNWMFPSYVDLADGGAASNISRVVDNRRSEGSKSGTLAMVCVSERLMKWYTITCWVCLQRLQEGGGIAKQAAYNLSTWRLVLWLIKLERLALANWHHPKMLIRLQRMKRKK